LSVRRHPNTANFNSFFHHTEPTEAPTYSHRRIER